MANTIWNMGVGRPVESSPGEKTNGEYSGLYRAKNASYGPVSVKHGSQAQEHLIETERRSLNEGEPFTGFLAIRRVDHVTLFIGLHPIYGISAYADRPTSHAGGRIEVITSTREKVITCRNDFFGQLLDAEIPESRVEAFCIENWLA